MRRTVILAFLLAALMPVAVLAQTPDDPEDEGVLVRVNGSDSVETGEVLSVAVVVNGDLDIAGDVTGAVVVVDGDTAVLNGATVEGSLVVVDGTVTLRSGATVTGDIYLSEDSVWVMEEGATFTGEVHQGSFAPGIGRDAAWQIVVASLAGWLGATLLAIAAAVIFAGIGGRQLWSSAGFLTARAGATILATVAFWLGLMLITIPLALSFIGILALPVVVIVGIAVWFLGYIAFATRLGASLTGQTIDDDTVDHPYLASIAGVVVLQIVLLIAVGCALAALLAGLLGDGREGLGIVFGVPALLFYVILWLAGLLGGGALVLRALNAWSARV